jgi:hypothetical protein
MPRTLLPIIVVITLVTGFSVLFARGPGYHGSELSPATALVPVSEPAAPTPTATAILAAAAPKLAAAPIPAGPSAAAKPDPVVPISSPAIPNTTTMASLHGDAVEGRAVFRKCAVCHSVAAGKNLIRPSLANVVGRAAGTEGSSGITRADEIQLVQARLRTLQRNLIG